MLWRWGGERRFTDEQPIHRKTGDDESESRQTLRRLGDNLIADDIRGRKNEDERDDRITPDPIRWSIPLAGTQTKESRGHEREEEPLGVHDAREQRAIGPGRDEDHRPKSLQEDRAVRGLKSRMNRRRPGHEQAIAD